MLRSALLQPGQQISLIDQTLEDARQKLKNIVVLAYESMAAEARAGLPIIRSNTGEVCVKYSRFEEAKASVMYAGTHSRGGSNSLVWVSEWGTIQATDLARSEEILTGASLRSATEFALSKAPGGADATGICGGWSSRPWRHPKSRRDRSTGDSPFSHGMRILAIATRYRGHLALRPGDTSRASRGLALAPGK